jgi:hypothetical protein
MAGGRDAAGAGGGAAVTDGSKARTSGGRDGTSGIGPGRARAISLGIFVLAVAIQGVSNATSAVTDRARDGLAAWEPWCWELTSIAALLLLAPLVWRAVRLLRPPQLSWPLAIAGHAALTIPFSLAHSALMIALRTPLYALMGARYVFFDGSGHGLLYEYRKDVATYVEFALAFALIQWIVARAAQSGRTPPPEEAALLVPEGAVTHRIPLAEIEQVTAAGNYVELAWRGRTLLHRATLAALEAELGAHGFVRIHRSRLVRRAAIRRIETRQSGDFEVELASGGRAKGSRRYRAGL